MQTTTKTITHSKTESTEMKANRPGYRIEYQPQLVEETVLRAIVAHPEEGLFRKERNAIYEMQDDETREEAFQELHQRWLQRLGLNTPLYEVLALWPILQCSTHKCLLLSARSKKDISADLFVTSKESGISEQAQRTIIIQLTAELLSQSQQ
ncbi:MAG: hypothetical protein ACE5HI_14120, partial [bacterium]